MTAPHKIYLSGCQEVQSYGDTNFSRHFTYKMNSFRKGGWIRSLIRISLYVLGFLLIAFSFIIIGMLLYPKFIGHCTRQVYSEQQANKINDHYLPSLGELLSGMVMCEEPYNDTSVERVKINNTGTESLFKNMDANYLVNHECKCLNSSEKSKTVGNDSNQEIGTELHIVAKCLCNETKETGDFERNNAGNENKTDFINQLNGQEGTPSQHIHINEMHTVDEISYLQSNACDCTNLRKPENGTRNAEDNENYYASFKDDSQCNCSEILESNFDINDTASSKEEYGSNPLDILNCRCLNRTLNETDIEREILDVEVTKHDECICPETQETQAFDDNKTTNGNIKNVMQSLSVVHGEVHDTPDLHFNETYFVNEGRKLVMESLNAGEASDKANLHFNETESFNENQSLIKDKCTCPKTRNMTYVLFNGTKLSDEMHDLEFKEDVVCECPELYDTDNFHKSTSETETSSNTPLNTQECVCSEISEIVNSESTVEGNKRGFKTINGECLCPEIHEIHNYNETEVTNGSRNHGTKLFISTGAFKTTNLPFNETERRNENQSLKRNKCICPKTHEIFDNISNETSNGFHDFDFSEDNGCICPSTEFEEINNYDMHKTKTDKEKNDSESVKTEECVCRDKPKSLGKGIRIENNRMGFRTVNGDCLCPETQDLSDIHGSEKESINEKEFNLDDGKAFMSVKGLTNGHESESVYEKESTFGDEAGTLNVNSLRNDSERYNKNEKELKYDDERNSSDTPLSFIAVTSAYQKELSTDHEKEPNTDDEKELTTYDETEMSKKQEMTLMDKIMDKNI